MTFNQTKQRHLGEQQRRGFMTFVLALVTAAVMFTPAILASRGYFLFFGDFNVQQIPFYSYCHDAILKGQTAWSFATDLGSDFLASYSFYTLGSPFFWLTMLLPGEWVPYAMGPLLIVKFACAALTAYLFLKRYTRTTLAAQAGGLLYAFSSFSVYNIFFNHFHEPLIVFPLLLLAMDLLLTENRRGYFAFCVALSALVNYYFFFGMAVFCVLYWLVRVLTKSVRFSLSRMLALAFEGLLGVAMAAALLLPSLAMIVGNGRVSEWQNGWSAWLYGKEQIYAQIIQSMLFPPDLPSRPVFCPDMGVKWSSIAAWLPVVGMTGVWGYCTTRRKSWVTKLLLLCGIFAFVPVLNSLFYAVNAAYYARWYYMPILLMCLATVVAMDDASINWKKGWKVVGLWTAGFVLVVGLFPQMTEKGWVFGLYKNAGSEDPMYLKRFAVSGAIAVVSLLITRGLIALQDKRKLMYRTAIAGICLVSVVYGMVYLHDGQSHSAAIGDTMINDLLQADVRLPESASAYRVDVYDGEDNTGLYLGYNSINMFHSVVSPSIMDFYEWIGQERNVASRPDTSLPSLRQLLSVKYLLNPANKNSFLENDGSTKMPGYAYAFTADGYYVYENERYIPYGFSFPYYLNRTEFETMFAEQDRLDMLLKVLVVEDDCPEKLLKGMTHFNTALRQDDPGALFRLMEGQDTDLVNTLTDDETLKRDASRLATTSCTTFSETNTGFRASCYRDEGNLVFFSVPYSTGWSCKVNGVEAEIVKADRGFMAVYVPAGVSEIVFTYTTPYWSEGLLISAGGVVVWLLYCLVAFLILRRKNRPMDGGKELMEYWKGLEEDASPEQIWDFEEDQTDVKPALSGESKYASGFHIDLQKVYRQKEVDKTDPEK